MPLRPRPELDNLVPSAHGGPNQAEFKKLGLKLDDIIDFSVSADPFMSPPELSKIVDSDSISRLPDPEATEFREVLSKKLDVPFNSLIAGNGAMELIHLIAQAYFSQGDSILIPEPTFGEYRMACQIAGAFILEHRAKEEENFAHRIDETVEQIKRNRPKGVFICNPNNPTGCYLSREEIETVLNACQDTLLVIDEAYVSFAENAWSSLDLVKRRNVTILRSMTKDQALAGLRLGYAVAHQDIINAMRRVQLPWSVNAVAQRAGIVALRNRDCTEDHREKIRQAKQFMINELVRIGYSPKPSETNFFLVNVGDGKGFRTALLRQGMLVRDCASFGLPEYVRIAVLGIAECKKLISAVEKLK